MRCDDDGKTERQVSLSLLCLPSLKNRHSHLSFSLSLSPHLVYLAAARSWEVSERCWRAFGFNANRYHITSSENLIREVHASSSSGRQNYGGNYQTLLFPFYLSVFVERGLLVHKKKIHETLKPFNENKKKSKIGFTS